MPAGRPAPAQSQAGGPDVFELDRVGRSSIMSDFYNRGLGGLACR
jgi:hypothetical protein